MSQDAATSVHLQDFEIRDSRFIKIPIHLLLTSFYTIAKMAPATKRRKLNQPEEITFDPEARQEYLTGFHKRKQARIKHAKEVAAKQEKEDRVRERRQVYEPIP